MRGPSLLPLALLLILPSCSKDKDSREWAAQDHDQPGQRPAATEPGKTNPQGDAYMKACASCHGIDGKGDGPMGRSLRVADLSSVAWQQRVSDEEITEVILKGRGQMPAFKLPPEELDAMVKKVRSFRR